MFDYYYYYYYSQSVQSTATRRRRGFRPSIGPDIQSCTIDLRHNGNTPFGDPMGLQTAPRELPG